MIDELASTAYRIGLAYVFASIIFAIVFAPVADMLVGSPGAQNVESYAGTFSMLVNFFKLIASSLKLTDMSVLDVVKNVVVVTGGILIAQALNMRAVIVITMNLLAFNGLNALVYTASSGLSGIGLLDPAVSQILATLVSTLGVILITYNIFQQLGFTSVT